MKRASVLPKVVTDAPQFGRNRGAASCLLNDRLWVDHVLGQHEFSERLSRIESSQKRLKGGVVLHVGDSEVNVRSISELRRVVAKPKPAVRFRPFAVIGAPLVGALGLVGALALRERFLTPELADTIKDHPDLALFGAGLVIAMVLGFVLRAFSSG